MVCPAAWGGVSQAQTSQPKIPRSRQPKAAPMNLADSPRYRDAALRNVESSFAEERRARLPGT